MLKLDIGRFFTDNKYAPGSEETSIVDSGGQKYVIPMWNMGRRLNKEEAHNWFNQTGAHFGNFPTTRLARSFMDIFRNRFNQGRDYRNEIF